MEFWLGKKKNNKLKKEKSLPTDPNFLGLLRQYNFFLGLMYNSYFDLWTRSRCLVKAELAPDAVTIVKAELVPARSVSLLLWCDVTMCEQIGRVYCVCFTVP